MTRQELATPPVIVVTPGMTLAQAIEAQERPVEGKCFWLGGHCDSDAEPGGWLCPGHREWRPNVATRDVVDAREFAWESAPHLKAVA